jgi:tetratricopeptide (TPR) repeat protein
MKIRSLLFGLLLIAGVSLPTLHSQDEADVTNTAPATSLISTQVVTVPGMDELWAQLEAAKRANEAASERWIALVDQNNSLSNVLAGLQTSLVSQKQREIQIAEEARTFNFQVMLAAAAIVVVILLTSYWFQFRCMNRVVEMTQKMNALPAPANLPPPMLEWQSEREGKLLEAVKLLESRIEHLETPANGASELKELKSNGTSTENGHSSEPAVKLIDVGPAELAPKESKISLLLAKGEILLDMERWEEALKCFQEALAMEPKNAEAHLKKGIALERLNRLEHSLDSYEEAVRLNPNRAFAYVYKARVLAALHRYDEALNVYDSALGKNGPRTEQANRLNGL